ncbi:MAG: hypothetical protein VX874_21165 [Pseudomonadota bacterium]|nr:hypothetical protein [Pseudomonadota bacterium]
MFPAAIAAAAPLALAGKALTAITSIAAEGKAGGFADHVAMRPAGSTGAQVAGPGGSRPGVVVTSELQPHNGAPLPPPPAVSQQPIPPTVEGIHQLYATMREMR